ncbi:LegC2/C7 family Dot/Icm T4SS effector [uncultured Legionella sp.]|uniref:LegC2/C7 family Dot/Icm T4SS effector n=1 Tax=uncultured Legionella sp. TaxID=210934 RepID=UPI00263A2191|nr:LegC2/C7 family Dot/Icm T4SS effector [uncultured Legionella sp.]
MTDTPVNSLEINEMELTSSIDTPSSLLNTDKAKKSLAEIEENEQSVATIKALIDSIIDSIAQNQSMLTRAALFWGKLPLWQKIGVGLLLIAPTLILGIVLHISLLIIISALTLITFVPTSLALDNHYEHDEQVTDQLKDSMTIMATSLESVLDTMEHLRSKLAHQIDNFHQENERLINGIISLSSQIDKLTTKSKELAKTEQELRAIQVDLENLDKTLRISVEEQTERLTKNQQEIDSTSQAFKANQDELAKTTQELDAVRKNLGKVIEDNQNVTQIMKETVEKLAKLFILDDQTRNEFQLKLDDFLTNKEKTFNEIAARIYKANQQLSLTRDELNRTNLRYESLLKRQTEQLNKLDMPARPSETDDSEVIIGKNAHKIRKFGINARTPSHHPEPQEIHTSDENIMRQRSVR